MILSCDDALIGMEVNEEKEVKLEPKDAYGELNPQAVVKIPKDKLPPEQEPKQGMVLMASTPDGKQMMARIVEVADSEVTLDLNHPLAGKTLNFRIKLVGINN